MTDRLNMLLWYIIAYFMLSMIYIYYVSQATAYMGFVYEFNELKLIVSLFSFFVIIISIPKYIDVRVLFLNIFITVYLIPCFIIYTFSNKSSYDLSIIIYAYILVYLSSSIRLNNFRIFSIKSKYIMVISIISIISLLFFIYTISGMKFFNLDISKVYEFRSESSDSLPSIFGYINTIFSKSIIPVGIVTSIMYKKYFNVFLIIVLSVILFGFTNHKGVLFYPVLSLFIYLSLKKEARYSVILMIFSFLLIASLADAAMFFSLGPGGIWGWLVDIVIRRGLFVPPLLDFHHLEFFRDNPKFYWSSSRITFGLIQMPYDLTAPYLIGREFFHSATTASNTGFIGNGYAQAGILGVTLYAFGVGLILSYLNACGKVLGIPFVTAIVFSQVITMMTGTDFLTMMLTHGMLVSLFLLMVIRPPENIIASRNKEPSLPLGLASEPPRST